MTSIGWRHRTIVTLLGTVLCALPWAASARAAHIYWATTSGSSTHYIARANLNGTGVDRHFIKTGNRAPVGLTISGGHLFWATFGTGTIARANLNGSHVDERFVHSSALNGEFVMDPAIGGGHIYFDQTLFGGGYVARADLNGGGVDAEFIRGDYAPWGTAVSRGYIYFGDQPRLESLVHRSSTDRWL